MPIRLPARRHPTLTLLVDDNRSFLESLAFQLPQQLALKTFDDTKAALDWLKLRDCVRPPDDGMGRFLTPSVLVVDYTMPHMNGLALCQEVQHMACKKILLTGLSGGRTGKDALSSGLIDAFIQKHDTDALQRLETEILRLQEAFFIDNAQPLHAFFSDPALASHARQLYRERQFVEHETCFNPPGILFRDANGRTTLMVVESKSGLQTHAERVRDHGGPEDLIAALKACRLIPCIADEGCGENWRSCCLPAQRCKGSEDHYWALFEPPPPPDPVYCYADFLRDLDAGLTA